MSQQQQQYSHTVHTRFLSIWDRPNGKKMTNADRRHQREFWARIEDTWLKCAGKPLKVFALAIGDNSESMSIAAKYDGKLARQYQVTPRPSSKRKTAISTDIEDQSSEDKELLKVLRSLH